MGPLGEGMQMEGGSTSRTGTLFLDTLSLLLWRAATVAVGLGAVVASFLYFKQDSLLYFPEIGGMPRRPSDSPRQFRSPSEYRIPFESHRIQCADGVFIHAWLLTQDPETMSKRPTVIFFHGNAGHIGTLCL